MTLITYISDLCTPPLPTPTPGAGLFSNVQARTNLLRVHSSDGGTNLPHPWPASAQAGVWGWICDVKEPELRAPARQDQIEGWLGV